MELEMKIQLLQEEKAAMSQNFDRRFTGAVTDFVQQQKEMAKVFENFKEMTRWEVRVHDEVRGRLEGQVEGLKGEIKILKEAIKIPR